MKKRPIENLNYGKLSNMTKGFSGADIKAACEMATDIPLKESIKTGKRRKIAMNDFELIIEKIQSVLKQWYTKANEQVTKKKLEDSFKELVTEANKMEKKEVLAA